MSSEMSWRLQEQVQLLQLKPSTFKWPGWLRTFTDISDVLQPLCFPVSCFTRIQWKLSCLFLSKSRVLFFFFYPFLMESSGWLTSPLFLCTSEAKSVCVRVCVREWVWAVSYGLGAAVRAGQPLPFGQHPHQAHDSHLSLGAADHLHEALRAHRIHAVHTFSLCTPVQVFLPDWLPVTDQQEGGGTRNGDLDTVVVLFFFSCCCCGSVGPTCAVTIFAVPPSAAWATVSMPWCSIYWLSLLPFASIYQSIYLYLSICISLSMKSLLAGHTWHWPSWGS